MTPGMFPASDYTEDALVERPAIAIFEDLGWSAANVYHETFGPGGTLGRETNHEVVLVTRLRRALETLNPDLSAASRDDAFDAAIEELTRNRSALSPEAANREVYACLKCPSGDFMSRMNRLSGGPS